MQVKCAVCGAGDEFEHACEAGWTPGVFVGNEPLGDLCGACCRRYGLRDAREGEQSHNERLVNVAQLFRDYPGKVV